LSVDLTYQLTKATAANFKMMKFLVKKITGAELTFRTRREAEKQLKIFGWERAVVSEEAEPESAAADSKITPGQIGGDQEVAILDFVVSIPKVFTETERHYSYGGSWRRDNEQAQSGTAIDVTTSVWANYRVIRPENGNGRVVYTEPNRLGSFYDSTFEVKGIIIQMPDTIDPTGFVAVGLRSLEELKVSDICLRGLHIDVKPVNVQAKALPKGMVKKA